MGLVAKKVGKVVGEPPTRILLDISLEIRAKEFVSLTGKSGSGKSTLLYLLSTLDSVSEGAIEIEGTNVGHLKSQDLHRFRNEKMGFVFQFHYLISELNVLENVLLPARRYGKEAQRTPHAKSLLEQFGLADKMHRLPRQLSGGEQQRVAIARALVMEPHYLFADEPTGSLDSVSGESVMNILRDANQKLGTTILMVTHDPDFAEYAQRQLHLVDGKLVP